MESLLKYKQATAEEILLILEEVLELSLEHEDESVLILLIDAYESGFENEIAGLRTFFKSRRHRIMNPI